MVKLTPENFYDYFAVATELDKIEWLKWITEVTEQANIRAAVCYNDNINFGNLLYLSATNHRLWADYLLDLIQK